MRPVRNLFANSSRFCMSLIAVLALAGSAFALQEVQEAGSDAKQEAAVQQEESAASGQQQAEAAPVEREGEPAAAEPWCHLTGRFKLTGDLPELQDEDVNKDQAACIVDGNVPKDDKLIFGENGELKNVFVIMIPGDAQPEIHPSYADSKTEPFVIDNVKCRFVPHASFVQVGQPIIMKNSDDIGHNCHITFFDQELNATVPQNGQVEGVLEVNSSSPGNVTCDSHSWMDGVIVVRDHPYVAISAEDGSFRLENIPEGTWEFQFWHKKTGYMKKLNAEGYEFGRKGNTEITFTKGETVDLGEMTFDADDLK